MANNKKKAITQNVNKVHWWQS